MGDSTIRPRPEGHDPGFETVSGGIGSLAAGLFLYEKFAPAAQSLFAREAGRARFFEQSYSKAAWLGRASGLFRTSQALERSVGFQRIKMGAMVAGFASMAITSCAAYRRLSSGTSQNRLEDRFLLASGIFGGATLFASLLFRNIPIIQFATMVGGMAVDATGLGISGYQTYQEGDGRYGSFLLQGVMTYCLGWDRHSREALTGALANLGTIGSRQLAVATAYASAVPAGAETAHLHLSTFLAPIPGSIATGPRPTHRAGSPLTTQQLDDQLHLGSTNRRTSDPVLVEIPLAVVRKCSPKLLDGDRWVPGFREVWDPRLKTTVVINTPGAVRRPRGIAVLHHEGGLEQSTPQTLLMMARWLNGQGFLVVIPSAPFHGLGPRDSAFRRLDHYMDWFRSVVGGAGDYFPDYKDLPRLLAGSDLGANVALEYACRFPTDNLVCGFLPLNPYAVEWGGIRQDLLGEIGRAGIVQIDQEAVRLMRSLDRQWTFADSIEGGLFGKGRRVDAFPGGRQCVVSRQEARGILDRLTEGSDLLTRYQRVEGLQGDRVRGFTPRPDGPRRAEVEALQAGLLERVRVETVQVEGLLATEQARARGWFREALMGHGPGRSDLTTAWGRGDPLLKRLGRTGTPRTDKVKVRLSQANKPVMIVSSVTDPLSRAVSPRHPEYWERVAGGNRQIDIVELPFADRVGSGTVDKYQQGSQQALEAEAAQFFDQHFPRQRIDIPIGQRFDWVMEWRSRVGAEVPTDRLLGEIATTGRQILWGYGDQAKAGTRLQQLVGQSVDTGDRAVVQRWIDGAEAAMGRKIEIFEGMRNETIAAGATDRLHFNGVEKMEDRDVRLWNNELFRDRATLFNHDNPEVIQVLRERLGITEGVSWGDTAVKDLVRDIQRHLKMEGLQGYLAELADRGVSNVINLTKSRRVLINLTEKGVIAEVAERFRVSRAEYDRRKRNFNGMIEGWIRDQGVGPEMKDPEVVELVRELAEKELLEIVSRRLHRDRPREYIQELIEQGVRPLIDSDLVRQEVAALRDSGIDLDQLPKTGEVPAGILRQLFGLVPVTLVQERSTTLLSSGKIG